MGIVIGWGLIVLIPIYVVLLFIAAFRRAFGGEKQVEKPTLTV